MDLQIVNLSKRYAWHRARPEMEGDDPEFLDDETYETEPQAERWALRGINAVIRPGEKVGIIGSNGAGKSTLLNILAGITLPSSGYVQGKGLRVLLNSLRAPFRAQLTGRQNLHILIALLGVDADRLEARIPEILAFSDMEDLIDRRVLHYSTQQYRRLTFAAALMLDPDIILSDDTLGIGDARYQQRTEQLIAEKVEKDGVIFLLASNRLSTIQELSTRVIWLENGRVKADGPAEEVIEAFMDADEASAGDRIEDVEATLVASETASGVLSSPAHDESTDPDAGLSPAHGLVPPDAYPLRGEKPAETGTVEPEAAAIAADTKLPLPEWSLRAESAIEQKSRTQQERMANWIKAGRRWLWTDKAHAIAPGLGELLDIQFNLCDRSQGDKSRLQIVVRLERPGTEVSLFIDGVFKQAHVFSSELPEHLIVPASGVYFFTVNIDNVLLQPRILEQPYTKSKLRIKVYLRAPDSDQWTRMNGLVRILLQGDEWNPQIPYPAHRAPPVLKPVLDWNVEMLLDESAVGDGERSEDIEASNRSALVGPGTGNAPS